VGVEVEQGEDGEDGDEPDTVDLHEERRLRRLDHRLRPRGGGHRQARPGHLVDQETEHELQRIDVEEDHEEEDRVEGDRRLVLQAVAPEVQVLLIPDPDQDGEADAEGDEAAHVGEELVEGARHLERDDEEGDGEAEHGVAEPLEAADLPAPEAEARPGAGLAGGERLADHGSAALFSFRSCSSYASSIRPM
jgi:hypothetical protein